MKIKSIAEVSAWSNDASHRQEMKMDREIIRIEDAKWHEEEGYYYAAIWFAPIPVDDNPLKYTYNGVFNIFGVTFDTPFEGETWDIDSESDEDIDFGSGDYTTCAKCGASVTWEQYGEQSGLCTYCYLEIDETSHETPNMKEDDMWGAV